MFNFDISQVLNAMKYSYLVNKNLYLINKAEYWLYLPYNMVVMIYSEADLMCSVKFNTQEIGKIREILWYSQKMARIGNWISTWEREIKEKDFTSGIFAYAISSDTLSINDIKKGNKMEIIKKIKKAEIEKKFLKEWEEYYFKIKKLSKKIKTIDIKDFLSCLQKLFIFHLSSRGYK